MNFMDFWIHKCNITDELTFALLFTAISKMLTIICKAPSLAAI